MSKKVTAVLASLILLVTPLFNTVSALLPAQANAVAYGDVLVRSTSPNGWNSSTIASGTTSFVNDSTAPYGNGALQLTTGSSTSSTAQRSKSVNMNLSDLTQLSYSTKQVSASDPAHAPSLQLTVNGLTGASSSTNLVFEPYWNGAGNPGVSTSLPSGTWQQWNVKDGVFWSSKGYASAGLTAGAGGPPFYSLAQVIAANPTAKITSVTTKIGSYNVNHIGLVDGVSLNNTVYDFEPAEPVLAPEVTATNFNTENNAGYRGLNVGFTLNNDFRNVSAVKVELFQNSTLLATNTDTPDLISLINSGEKSLSTPFVISPVSYTDNFWTFSQRDWLKTETPIKVVITVTDNKGSHTAQNTSLIQPNGWTFESLFDEYSQQTSDSKFVSPIWTVRENTANDTKNFFVQTPTPTTKVRFSFVGKSGAPTIMNTVGEEHIQPGQ